MSANNYSLIHKVGNKYYFWDNLNAEEAVYNPKLSIHQKAKEFDTLGNAIEYANANSLTEYGYQINDLHKPKDGYPEKIIELNQ